jgi:hypothetical protein
VIRDIRSALFAPRRFFGELRARPPNVGRAFLALLVPLLLGALLQGARADAVLAQLPTELARELSPQAFRTAFYVGLVFTGPLTAAIAWLSGWAPIRLGAGRFERIGEVSAWTQLPAAVAGFFNLAASASGLVIPPPLALAVQIGATLWCVWLVYEALGTFSPRSVRGGVIAYALFAAGALALGFGAGATGAARSPSGLMF